MDYMEKFKGVDGRRSIYDILSLTPYKDWEIIKTEYDATEIAHIKIDGNTFKNYGQYQFIWEKTFVKSPERSSNGSIGNLNSYATFLTPHLIINFSLMSIDDYRAIMKMHYERNEFTVECYDFIYNKPIKVKMYFATEEMAKLYTINKMRQKTNGEWEDWIELVGVQDYSVELIGTNNELDLVSVKYEYNAPLDNNGLPIYPNGAPIPPQYEEDIYLGEEIVVGSNSTFPNTPPSNNYQFSHWTMLGENGDVFGNCTNGLVMTVNSPITFRAEWKPTSTRTLSFNYGLSDEDYTVTNGIREPISNRPVQQGQSIGTLPKLTVEPSEIYNGELVYPYHNGAWYRTPSKNTRVNDNDLYWIDRDTIIYALYDKKLFSVTYHTNAPDITIPTQSVAYDEIVYAPTLYRTGYTFKGWYTDSAYEKAFSGKMPPQKLNLYARWVKQ